MIEKKGKPALVMMNMAHLTIERQQEDNPGMKKLTELQKGRIAYNYIRMNNSPKKYKYFRRFIDNEGDVKVPGFNPLNGKYESIRELHHNRST